MSTLKKSLKVNVNILNDHFTKRKKNNLDTFDKGTEFLLKLLSLNLFILFNHCYFKLWILLDQII